MKCFTNYKIFENRLILAVIICISGIWLLKCQKSDDKEVISSQWKSTHNIPGNLFIHYPQKNTLFPPDIIAPTIIWRDSSKDITNWYLNVYINNKEELVSTFVNQQKWQPTPEQWESIKISGLNNTINITVLGYKNKKIISGCNTTIQVSADSVEAPIFYRAVPLPFQYALDNLNQIRWYLGDISSYQQPPVILENLELCGNCHSFTSNGNTLAMDVDYANDKGSYVISDIEKETILTEDKIITWSDYRRDDGQNTFGLLSQISPDGRYVASTVKDQSIFVATSGLKYSQLFFPIKGIIAIYDRNTKKYYSLPGADDPKYVQSNPCWSPNGKYIYFARSLAYRFMEAEQSKKVVLATSMAKDFIEGKKEFKYDIYRIPFNNGRGGKAIAVAGASNNSKSNFFPRVSPDGKWLVFTQADNFMLLQPDSRLFLIPADGGTPREMSCNTSSMNSWHSWSPNGKWLVFSSKARGPYADFMLTHIDENGQDTPPVLLENLSFPKRSGNIPEFVNINSDEWQKIIDNFSNQAHYYLSMGHQNMNKKNYTLAIENFEKVIQMDPSNIEAIIYKAHSEYNSGKYQQAIITYNKAITKMPDNIDVLISRGKAQYKLKDYSGAIESYSLALKLDDKNSFAYNTRGNCKAKMGDILGAIKDFDKAIELGPLLEDPFYDRGLCNKILKNYQSALDDFQKAIDINPNNVNAIEKKGICYYEMKQYKNAIELFNKALILKPEAKEIYTDRAFCKIALKDLNGALNDYDEVLKIYPNSALNLYNRGILKISLNQKESGCIDLYRAKDLGYTGAQSAIQENCMK